MDLGSVANSIAATTKAATSVVKKEATAAAVCANFIVSLDDSSIYLGVLLFQ